MNIKQLGFSTYFQLPAAPRRVYFLLGIDLVLLLISLVMIFTNLTILSFHLVFLLLTLGAFYWSLRGFIIRTLFWLTLTSGVLMVTIVNGAVPHGEFIEIPVLVSMLGVVFLISRQRRLAETALRHTNETLEMRIAERTSELVALNQELVEEIVERKLVEANLRQISAKNQAVLDVIPDSFIFLDSRGRIKHSRIAPNAGTLLARIQPGKSLGDFLPPDLVALVLDNAGKALESNDVQIFTYALTALRNEEDFEIRLVVSGPDEVMAIVRNISDLNTIERERKRIFRELHDGIGQLLGFLHLKLDHLRGQDVLPASGVLRSELAQMHQAVGEAYELVRSILVAANPAKSNDLETALLLQIKSLASHHGLKANFNSVGDPHQLPHLIARNVFSIAKEALSNTVKHASASNIEIGVTWEPGKLFLAVRDDGCGFAVDRPVGAGHFGIDIMKERAREIKGDLSISSERGKGTEITLQVPL
jgi:signal transduction histidine kinase